MTGLTVRRTQFYGPPPTVLTLCGSSRFASQVYQDDLSIWTWANLHLTLLHYVVLSIGCDTKSDMSLFVDEGSEAAQFLKRELDELHKRKIDMAQVVLMLNQDDYLGSSSLGELTYARNHGKIVMWAFPSKWQRDSEQLFTVFDKPLFQEVATPR